MTQYSQNGTFSGLQTLTVVIPSTGLYFFRGSLTLPQLTGGSSSASQCVVTIKQNGSAVYTGTAGATGFQTEIQCTAADSIAIGLTSAAAVDNTLNAVKGTVSIGSGEQS